MKKSIEVKLNRNKSNGQYNVSIPVKKLKGWGLDIRNVKSIKINLEDFE